MKSVKTSIDEGTLGLCPPNVKNKELALAVFSRARLNIETGCWEWTGGKIRGGYGSICLAGRAQRAHRAAFVATYGAIPVGLCICHRCDNPTCVNPNHLFAGSQSENLRDAIQKGRRSVLDVATVLQIKSLLKQGISRKEIAQTYGTSKAVVTLIALGTTWAWIE